MAYPFTPAALPLLLPAILCILSLPSFCSPSPAPGLPSSLGLSFSDSLSHASSSSQQFPPAPRSQPTPQLPSPLPRSAPAPVVSTPCGNIQGAWITNPNSSLPIASFLGIPYGAPPQRWSPPHPATCWGNSTLQAVTQPRACIQWHAAVSPQQGESEDCLFLNVFAPQNASNLPVLVWLYGGDNCFGSTTSYGDFQRILDENHRAVIVAPNFRLGALGFLALRELSLEDPRGTSGNYAILDTQLALRWVQQNIASFGGNPDTVTVIGQSSGGTNILAMLASPASRGLFQAAISLSGSPNITMDLATVEEQGRALVANTTCKDSRSADLLACLRALTPEQILDATPDNWDYAGSFPINPKGDGWAGLVVVDGVTVAMPLLDALRMGLVDVPVIIQTMSGELDFMPTPGVQNWTAAQVKQFFRDHFASWGADVGNTLVDLYTPAMDPVPSFAYYAAGADIGVGCGTLALANAAARGFKSNVFVSVVTQWPSHPMPTLDPSNPSVFPFHLFDFIAGFRVWDFFSSMGFAPFRPNDADLALGDILRDSWFALAVNGSMPDHIPWRPVATAAGFPDHYNMFTMAVNGSTVVDYKRDTCMQLLRLGMNEKFWWVN